MASTTGTTQGTTTTEASTTTTATTTSTSTTTTAAPPTTVASTTTAPPDGDGPPPLNPVPADEDDLDEYARIYREHLAYQNWLGLHPTTDPALLGLAYHPEGPWSERFNETMLGLIDDGTHVIDDLSVEFAIPLPDSDPSQGVVVLTVRANRTVLQVVDDASGEVHFERDEHSPVGLVVELRRTDDGRWLVWSQDTDGDGS